MGNPPQLGRASFSEAPDSGRVSETGTGKAADGAEKSKRKGRFQIVEEDSSDPGKRGVGRSTSVASMDSRPTQVRLTPHLLPYCSCGRHGWRKAFRGLLLGQQGKWMQA